MYIEDTTKEHMISQAAQELCAFINFLDYGEADMIAKRIFEVWDAEFADYETYEDYLLATGH